MYHCLGTMHVKARTMTVEYKRITLLSHQARIIRVVLREEPLHDVFVLLLTTGHGGAAVVIQRDRRRDVKKRPQHITVCGTVPGGGA